MPNMVITSCAYVRLFLFVAWKQGRKEARKKGSKEERKKGRKEARKKGSKEERKQGRKEARKKGSKEAISSTEIGKRE